jgi:putative PIN family toxin of toxin-antitoxin system
VGTTPLMRVVLDSNILLSALISPHGAPHRIYAAWRARRFELVTCPTQLKEIRRASRYPKLRELLQPHRVDAMVNALGASAVPDPPLAGHEADDPGDAWLFALAKAFNADWLVTGDRRSGLLARGHVGRAQIVTAAAFCASDAVR